MAKCRVHSLTDNTVQVLWELSQADPEGEAYVLPFYRSATVQTDLIAGVVECYGSLWEDGKRWSLLHAMDGSVAMVGSCELKDLRENVHRFKPVFKGEGGPVEFALMIRRS